MSNLSLSPSIDYHTFSQLKREGLLLSQIPRLKNLPENQQNALSQLKLGAHKLLGSGIVGDDMQLLSQNSLRLEKSLKLGQGEWEAANIKAVLGLGQQVVQDEGIRQALGQIETPFTAVLSVNGMQRSLKAVGEDPNPHNLKYLMSSTRGLVTTVGEVSTLVVEHAPALGGEVAKVLARGSSNFIGRVGPVLNVGIATMDVALAGKDIHSFWQQPTLKNFAQMSLGAIAASASVLKVAVPSLQTPATVVATLADLGKLGLNLDWKSAGQGLGLSR